MDLVLSGFADEISSELNVQLEVIKSLGMEYICIRTADSKSIAEYGVDEFEEKIHSRLKKENVKVSSLGSPIGKVKIDDEEGFTRQLAQLENLCLIAKNLDCKYIRVFSFYIDETEDYDIYTEQVVEKVKKFVEIAEKHQIVLLHENEKDIFGDIARRCKLLFDRIVSPYFKAAFDFANFVQCNEDVALAYDLLREHTVYIHIKDAVYEDGHNVPFGDGDGKGEEVLRKFIESGYKGFLTLEPHLFEFDALKSLEVSEVNNVVKNEKDLNSAAAYALQLDKLKEVLAKII